ncbi:hypothetical protein [Nocardia sp. NBC_01009]|uniref:hypothetical protein n=1 Tax=Nocardia sp. NBC_01009 TaxID=2975996 RepID=UPI003864D00A|nr:tweety family protein [Nocardia sp. NBC_01009]
MGSFSIILYSFLMWFRWIGTIALTIIIMFWLVSVAASSKLSLPKVLGVVGSGIIAVVMFWILPTVVNYARSDANIIVPDHPIGSYR